MLRKMHFIFYLARHMRENYFIFNDYDEKADDDDVDDVDDEDDVDDNVDDGIADLV